MTQQHHITPPPELVQRWLEELYGGPVSVISPFDQRVLIAAAQWGADQELEACCIQLADKDWYDGIKNLRNQFRAAELRSARRPKPPSLKEQALLALNKLPPNRDCGVAHDTIRRALEQLPDHE